jgi:hypothetical protein
MFKASVVALALGFSFSGYAAEEKKAEGQSTIKVEDTTGKKNKVDGNIDEEVTNQRMRAESGSKSKFSLSTKLAYTGGNVTRAFGSRRPPLSADPSVQTSTSADIGVDARYRFTKTHSATLGTSFGLMTPFQGDEDSDKNQLNVYDPRIGWSVVGKIGEVQANGSLTYYHGTSQESKNVDQDAALVASYSFLKAWPNKLTTGMSFTLADYYFGTDPGEGSNPGLTKSRAYGGDKRTDWSVGVFPFAEYVFTDRYSFRTVFGYFNWRHLYGDNNKWRLLQTYVYQSVGIGISVTRDIYLYPNVQFVPDNIRSDFTNVALSATINTF